VGNCRCSPTNRCGRCCIRCVEHPALPDHDLCLDCVHVELAKRSRKPKKARAKTYSLSLSGAFTKRLAKEAKKRGTNMRKIVEQALADLPVVH
jgi:hypothetical protein